MISIAKDFSESPAARYRHEGPNSGQRFREDFLLPAIQSGYKVVINLDGVVGFGSSFLEEAFGGLVRCGFSLSDLEKCISIETSLQTYKNRIWRYIKEESARQFK